MNFFNTLLIGYLNDLWKFDLQNKQWTWMGGADYAYDQGVYGEKGEPSTEYLPNSRYLATWWYDSTNEELWLFSGFGYENGSEGTVLI